MSLREAEAERQRHEAEEQELGQAAALQRRFGESPILLEVGSIRGAGKQVCRSCIPLVCTSCVYDRVCVSMHTHVCVLSCAVSQDRLPHSYE
jgi:hypothetical protein